MLNRRALIAAAPAVALTAVPVAVAAQQPIAPAALAFVEKAARSHPRGRFVAQRALALGLDPADCETMQTYCIDNPDRMPVLIFRNRKPGKQSWDWVVVGPDFDYEYGSV